MSCSNEIPVDIQRDENVMHPFLFLPPAAFEPSRASPSYTRYLHLHDVSSPPQASHLGLLLSIHQISRSPASPRGMRDSTPLLHSPCFAKLCRSSHRAVSSLAGASYRARHGQILESDHSCRPSRHALINLISVGISMHVIAQLLEQSVL